MRERRLVRVGGRLGLGAVVAFTIGAGSTVAVAAQEAAPALVIFDDSATESDRATFTQYAHIQVVLRSPAADLVTVDFQTADGTATAGADYVARSGQLSFPPGSYSARTRIKIISDTVVEPEETFVVNLSNPVGATIDDGQALVTIEDRSGVRIDGIGTYPFMEGDSGTTDMAFNVRLNGPATTQITVEYRTEDGDAVAGSDYLARSGTLTFSPGDTTEVINVPIVGDTVPEPFETFNVFLSDVTGTALLGDHGVGFIRNDDGISVTSAKMVEGDSGIKNMVFTVKLSAASAEPTSYKYRTVDGTATAGSDYVARSGPLNFAAGETSKTIEVPIIGDTFDEHSELFRLRVFVSNPDADLTPGGGQGRIVSDDGLKLHNVSIVEGDTGTKNLVIKVALSPVHSGAVSVDYFTVNGTRRIPKDPFANGGSDYIKVSGTLTFAPGETAKSVSIPIIGDTTAEPDELFTFVLRNPVGTVILDFSSLVTIVNDD